MILKKCLKCKRYTLKDKCICGGEAVSPHPPRFSMEREKKYGKYRRQAKT